MLLIRSGCSGESTGNQVCIGDPSTVGSPQLGIRFAGLPQRIHRHLPPVNQQRSRRGAFSQPICSSVDRMASVGLRKIESYLDNRSA